MVNFFICVVRMFGLAFFFDYEVVVREGSFSNEEDFCFLEEREWGKEK